MYFNSGAVVFDVGDEYQIAISTSKSSVASVQIGDRVFYDSTGGSKNVSTIHKISVPKQLLDEVKSYTFSCTSVIRNRAYLASSGATVKKSFSFRPVDLSDGIQIFNFSDNHLIEKGAVSASRYFGDELDMLIANGDHFNDVSDEFQVTLVYKTLGKITSGSLPVIMTRGNHESVGSRLKYLPDYIPSKDGKFYYTLRVGDVMFYVLDLACDLSDDGAMAGATANFDEYRAEEYEWLKTLPSEEDNEDGAKYRVALCHMPYVSPSKDAYWKLGPLITAETERIGVDLLISGHQHRSYVYEPYSMRNIASYPCVIGGKRSNTLEVDETIFAGAFTGAAIEILNDGIYLKFVNAKLEILHSQKLI